MRLYIFIYIKLIFSIFLRILNLEDITTLGCKKMVKWLKRISILMVMVLCSGIFLVGCGDLYGRLTISLIHSGGIENKIEMTLAEGTNATYELIARVEGVKKGVSDKIRYEITNGDHLSIDTEYLGDGETKITITATNKGKATLIISTAEGNKTKKVEVTVYKKVEGISFSSSKLAVKKNGSLNLNNYINFEPGDTNQIDLKYELVRIKVNGTSPSEPEPVDEVLTPETPDAGEGDGETGDGEGDDDPEGDIEGGEDEVVEEEFEYSENYAQIVNGVLTVDPNATLPIDPVTNLPYVTLRAVSAFDETITTEIINIPVIEQVEESSILLQSNSNNGQVTLVKNETGIYRVVLASNVGFTNVEGADSVLFKRRLSFLVGDEEQQSKYEVLIDEKYLESYQFNPNLTDEEREEIANYPVLITKLDNLTYPSFDVIQKTIGNLTVPFTIRNKEFDGLPDIVITVKFEVIAFPTEISAVSKGKEITAENPLVVLNLYSNNLNGSPLTITTNNDKLSTNLYFTYEIDKGSATSSAVTVATSNPNNVYTEGSEIRTGSTIYLFHGYESDDVEDITDAYIIIKYTYDLNPQSVAGGGEGAVIGNFAYSIEKRVPLTFRAGIDEIPLESEEIRINATNTKEVRFLKTTLGVFADEFTYTTNTNLFTLRIERTEAFIVPNLDGLSGSTKIVIRDDIRNLYRVCTVIVYVPLAYTNEDTFNLQIDTPTNYKNEILEVEYIDQELVMNAGTEEAKIELVKNYSTLKRLTLKVGSVIPFNAFNYIFDPLLDLGELTPESNLVEASEKYIRMVNINHYISSVEIEKRYGYFNKETYSLHINNNTFTNAEDPLIVTFNFEGYNANGERILISHSFELLIYSLITNLNVSISNPNIYEYNSVGALNIDKASTTIAITNVLNNATTTKFEMLDKEIVGFAAEKFTISDLFTQTVSADGKSTTIISKPSERGLEKLNSLVQNYGSVNNVLKEIYATNFQIDVVVTITQFGRELSNLATIGTIYAVKSERIILNNVNSTGLYFDARNLVEGYSKDISFTIEPSNAFNKTIRLIYDANNVFDCEMLTSNIVRIYPRNAGVSNLRLAFEDSYEDIDGVLVATKYIDIRVKVADGSELYPFEINNINDFESMLNDINAGSNSYHYVLANSLNLTSYNYVTPVNEFNGSLNGLFEYQQDDIDYSIQNTITGLNINIGEDYAMDPDTNSFGLFSVLGESGAVKNLNLIDVNINISNNYLQRVEEIDVGVIAGINKGIISNSRVTGEIYVKGFANGINVGGFAGVNDRGVITGLPSVNNGLGDSDINSNLKITLHRVASLETDVSVTFAEKMTNIGGLVGLNIGKFATTTIEDGVEAKEDEADILNVKAIANIEANSFAYTVEEVDDETVVNETEIVDEMITIGGVIGYSMHTKVKDVVVRVNNITGFDYIGGIIGCAVQENIIENNVVQFVNRGLIGIDSANIVGYSSLGALIGCSEGLTSIKYSYARSFYNKQISDINNSTYFGNIVSLANGDEYYEVAVGGLVGSAFDLPDFDENSGELLAILYLSIENSYAIVDINVSVNAPATADNQAKYFVGGLVGFGSEEMMITNSYSLSNIKMPQAFETTKDVVITVISEAGEGVEPGAGGEEPPEVILTEETKTIPVPSFGYYVGNENDLTLTNVTTTYSVINRNPVNNEGHYSYITDTGVVSTSEEVFEREDEEGTVKYLLSKYDLVSAIEELNGFIVTTDHTATGKVWYKNDRLNEGFPVLFDSNNEIMYTILPSSIVATISEESVEFTNNSHIRVSDKKVILFYNALTSGTEYLTNNTYKVVLVGNEVNTGVNYNNLITVSLGVDPDLQGIVKVESSVTVESSNSGIVSIENGNTLKTLREGVVTITIFSTIDQTIKTEIEVMVVNGLSSFDLYSGGVSDANLVSTKQQLIIDKVYKYTTNAENTAYFNGISGTYVRNSNIGYIVSADAENDAKFGTSATNPLNAGESYLYNSLGVMNLVGFASGDATLTYTPVLFTGNSEFGSTIYVLGNRVLTDAEVEEAILDGSISDCIRYDGVVKLSKLEKSYMFEVIEKAKSLSLNNNLGKTILPTGSAEVNITIVTSAFTDLGGGNYQINEKLNVLIYKDGVEVGLLNLDHNESIIEYEENRSKDAYNDTLIVFNDLVVSYEKIDGENQIRVYYKFYLTFNQEKYLQDADLYSMNDLDYELIFFPYSNVSLKELETSKYIFTIKPQTIQDVYTSFYASGQTSVTNEFNPLESTTEFIAPGRYGLLVINVYPKFNDADYYEVTVPEMYKQNITVTQMYALYDNSGASSLLRGYQDAVPSALQLSDYRGVRLYNISNNFGRFDGNLYVRVLVTSSIPMGATITLTVNAYKNGVSEPIENGYATCQLTVSELPGINANIGGKTKDILLAKTFSKTGAVLATEFDGEIEYEITSRKSNASDYEVQIIENTSFIVTAKETALGGDDVTITFKVSKKINGIKETAECKIYLKIVEYEILSVSVKDAAKNDSGENQLDILNGVTKLLNVNIEANINANNANVLADKNTLAKHLAGQDQISTQVSSPNNWYRRGSYGSDPYNDISLSVTSNSSIKFTHYEFINRNKAYYIKALRISDVNVLVLKASYYYNENGIPRAYVESVDTNYTVYEYDFVFRLNIKDNSTYDHPNPVYTYEDIANMQPGSHYILMNNLTISDFVPFKVDDFASFDGNGYTITINNFDLTEYKGSSSSVNIGLFEKISSGSIVKNIILDVSKLLISQERMQSLNNETDAEIIEAYDIINASNITNMNFGLIAGENAGTITNVKVINTSANSSNYLYVYLTQSKIGNLIPQARIGGIVANNSGIISNSFIGINAADGADESVFTYAIQGESYAEVSVKTYPFRLCGSNNIAGVAYSNSNKIIGTYANGVGVINTSLLGDDDSITAGFVGTNEGNALLSNVFVQGTGITKFRANEDYRIESKGNMGGLVYSNAGEIRDAYSNIAIKTNSKRSGGFVFENTTTGTIKNAYSTAKNSVGSRAHGAFIGTNEIGETNNSAKTSAISSVYYLVVGDEYVNEYEIATPIKSSGDEVAGEEIGTSQADPFLYAGSFNGFSFSLGAEKNSIWTYTNTSLGPQLISCVSNETYSHRTMADAQENGSDENGEIIYTYSYDYDESVGNKNTGYGEVNNPLIVRTGKEFVDFIINNSNASNVFGGEDVTVSNIRLIDNIDLSAINLNTYTIDGKTLGQITFNGILDGNNLEITGIKLLDDSKGVPKETYGLFKQVGLDSNSDAYRAVIKNTTFNVEQLLATNVKLVGVVAGKSVNTAYINTHVTGSAVIQGRNVVGGLTGVIAGNSSLIEVTSSISIASVYRTQVTTTNLLPYFEYGFSKYEGNYDSVLKYSTYNCDFGYAGGIAGIIDVENTDVLDPSSVSPTSNYLEQIFDVGSGENRLTTKFRTIEPTSPIIKNLKVFGDVIISGEYAGGLFGYVGDHTHIYDSVFELSAEDGDVQEINGLYYSGGLVAENHGFLEKVRIEYNEEKQLEIDNKLLDNGTIKGNQYIFNANKPIIIGGLVGYNEDGIIIDSYSKVNVYNQNAYVAGGVVGKNKGYALMQHVYTTGAVRANYVTGGIFGYVNTSKYAMYDNVKYYASPIYSQSGEVLTYENPKNPDAPASQLALDTYEKIVLDYVVALNTWNTETVNDIKGNFNSIYSYATENGGTAYYNYSTAMPEIGNQYVEKMYKIVETNVGTVEVVKEYVDLLESLESKEWGNSNYYTYNYSKNIGSIIGRISSVGENTTTEFINTEVGGEDKDGSAYNVGITNAINTSVISEIDLESDEGIKEFVQKDITVYSVTNSSNIVSNEDITPEVSGVEYNKYNYYNYIGWQRPISYLVGESVEVNTIDPEDKTNIMEDNVFQKWVTIQTEVGGQQEKVFKISEETNLPEYIVGIYSNLVEIESITDWDEHIKNATSTKNKYFAITKDLTLSIASQNYGKFEGNLIGTKEGGGTPTITVNVDSFISVFNEIRGASITNVNFVINYLSTNELVTMSNSYKDIGTLAHTLYNSVLTNCNISVDFGEKVGRLQTQNNTNIGGVFGSVETSTISYSIENPEIKVSNFANRQIIVRQDQHGGINLGLFAGRVVRGAIPKLPFNTGGSTEINVKVTNNKIEGDIVVGGLIGASNNTSYDNIQLSTTDNIDIFISNASAEGLTISKAYVGGLIGKLENGTMSNVSHIGSIYVGPSDIDTLDQSTSIQEMYIGGALGYVSSSNSIKNISNGVSFDDEAMNLVSPRVDNKIIVNGAAITKTLNVGGVAGFIQATAMTGEKGAGSTSLKAKFANNAKIQVSAQSSNADVYIGGIVGNVNGSEQVSSITKAFNSAEIIGYSNSSKNYIGGIVGYAQAVNINTVYNIGNINVENISKFDVGGIAGVVGTEKGEVPSKIENVVSYGDFYVTNVTASAKVSGILGNGLYRNVVNMSVVNTVSMSRTIGTNDNNGYVQGIGNNFEKVESNYYISEFAIASTNGTGYTYGSFGTNIQQALYTGNTKFVAGTNVSSDTMTPRLVDLYMFNELGIANMDMREGSKFNPQIIDEDITSTITIGYAVISSSKTEIKVSSQISSDFTGVIASTDNTTINFTMNSPFIKTNNGILSGIKLNVTNGNSTTYLTETNGLSGLIYNCGVVGSVTNSNIKAPIALTNNGRVLRTGVALLNNATTYTSETSGFIMTNNGIISECYSTLQSPNATSGGKKYGLLKENNGTIKQSYFGGWFNGEVVSDQAYSKTSNIYIESHVGGGVVSETFFNSASNKTFTSPPWRAQGVNSVNNINFGYPVLDDTRDDYKGALQLYTTYSSTSYDYAGNSGNYLIVTHSGMFDNMNATKSYLLASNITISNTYSLDEFKGTFNGMGKTLTIESSLFNKLNSANISNIKIVGSKAVESAIAKTSITDSTLSDLSFEKISANNALITPTLNSSGKNSILTNITIGAGNSIGKSKQSAIGAIVSQVEGSATSQVTISNINTGKNIVTFVSEVLKSDTIGGLFGSVSNATIDNVYNATDLTTTSATSIGGIVGYANSVEFKNCYNTASISGVNNVGGIVGKISTGNSSFSNVYNGSSTITKTITASESYAGGIVGTSEKDIATSGEIINYMAITAKTYLGGIAGNISKLTNTGKITNNGIVTATKVVPEYVAGVVGKTTVSNTGTITNNANVEVPWTDATGLEKVTGQQLKFRLDDAWVNNFWADNSYLNTTFEAGSYDKIYRGFNSYSTITNKNVRLIIGNQSSVSGASSTARIIVNQKAATYAVSSDGNWHCTYTIFGMHQLWTENLTVRCDLYSNYSFDISGQISYDDYNSYYSRKEKIWTDSYDRPQNTNTDRWDNVFVKEEFTFSF